MNLRKWLAGLFTGGSANGHLQSVRESGQRDGEQVAGAYVEGFEAGASNVLEGFRKQFALPFKGGDVVDAEFEELVDFGELSRPELMRLAKDRGLEYGRSTTRDELVEMLS